MKTETKVNAYEIDEERVIAVRNLIWKLWEEIRDIRGTKKTLPIFGVEMTFMELGVFANGMRKKIEVENE